MTLKNIQAKLIFVFKLILGKEVVRTTKCDNSIIKDLFEIKEKYENELGVNIESGKTLCANDFYEGIIKIK